MSDDTKDERDGITGRIELEKGKGQIISLAKAKEDREGAPLTRKPWTYKPGACRHEAGFLVDPDEHEVTCRNCEKTVDPFKAIWAVTIGWDWENAKQRLAQLKSEAEALRKEVDALKAIRSKETAATMLPGKHVRKVLRSVVDRLKREAALCTSQKDKTGARAYESAATQVRWALESLVDKLVSEGE